MEEGHYLAHHPVVCQDKQTTKVRVVYDASAKMNGGLSLNECLNSGPLMSETTADVLVRFRCHKTALVGDQEKVFLMISVAEDDHDTIRFRWFDDPSSQEPKIIVLRFARVVFGLSYSAFLSHSKSEETEFVQKLLQSLYVAGFISGDSDDNGAYELYIKAKSRPAKGGFNARKFVSNFKKLTSQIEQNEIVIKQLSWRSIHCIKRKFRDWCGRQIICKECHAQLRYPTCYRVYIETRRKINYSWI